MSSPSPQEGAVRADEAGEDVPPSTDGHDHSPLQRVLEITRDILRSADLDAVLESIAAAVRELFGFAYVTIVIEDPDGELVRRVVQGYPEDVIVRRRNERVSRDRLARLLERRFEIVEDCFYVPAETHPHWPYAIYEPGSQPDGTRPAAGRWTDRDLLCAVIHDEAERTIGYLSPGGPLDGDVPDETTLRGLSLFVNLVGLAIAKTRAHRGEIERRELLERSAERLQYEATHDPLTGLANRAAFRERLGAALDRSRSGAEAAGAVLFFDLDEFKHINDTLGHLAGDALLRIVAERLRFAVRSADVVARIGGDEFAVLLQERVDRTTVERTVHRVQESLIAPASVDGHVVHITASVGIALLEGEDELVEDALRRADAAMYHAKSGGAARFAYYEPEMLEDLKRRLALSGALRAALEARTLAVHFQPVVRIADGAIVALEALARWYDPEHGDIEPAEFLALAGEVGLLVPLGRFVFEEVARRASVWCGAQRRLRVHVNLSAIEALDAELPAFLAATIERYQLSPRAFVFDMTEAALLRARSGVDALRAAGFGLSIDEFGTGTGALRLVHELSVDVVKIDRLFVSADGDRLGSEPIVRMLTNLASSYGFDVVAEGVETVRQAEALRGLGCGFAQGFYYHRPLTAEAATALVLPLTA